MDAFTQSQQKAKQEEEQAKLQDQRNKTFAKASPTDPWRWMGDHVEFSAGDGWVQFCGTVTQTGPDYILLDGWCGTPTATNGTRMKILNFPSRKSLFTLENRLFAKQVGVEQGPASMFDRPGSVLILDYGKPCPANYRPPANTNAPAVTNPAPVTNAEVKL